MLYFIPALIISLLVTYACIRSGGVLGRFTHDHDLEGVQKFHSTPTPRVGGMGVILGCAIGSLLYWYQTQDSTLLLLLAVGLPAFLGGIIEDLTKKVTPRDRLLLTFVSAVLAFYLLGAQLNQTHIPWIDVLLENTWLALLLTVVAVGGVSHSINIIDGFNGLMTGYSLLAFTAFGLVGYLNNDALVLTLNLIAFASVLGLFLFNFPHGKIFAGDGGAYLIGFLLAESGLLLLTRNPAVSPWFVLLVLIYPGFEVLFSIYRRKILRGVAISEPDDKHLHTLIYRRVIRPQINGHTHISKPVANAMTSKHLWGLSLVALIPAVLLWNDTISLILFCAVFCIAYVTLYWRIVRFKSRLKLKALQRREAKIKRAKSRNMSQESQEKNKALNS